MLTQTDAREIARKLGAEKKRGRKHELVVVRYGGIRVGQYGISRSSKEKSHDYIANQLHISLPQCRELSACPLSKAEYFKILSDKNLIR